VSSFLTAHEHIIGYSVPCRASNTDHVWQYRYFEIGKRQYRYTGIDTGISLNDAINEKILRVRGALVSLPTLSDIHSFIRVRVKQVDRQQLNNELNNMKYYSKVCG